MGLGFVLFTLFAPSSAYAESACEQYAREAPQTYKVVCGKRADATKPPGAASTYSSAFNISPAAIPTSPSPYGLEVIGSVLRSSPNEFGPTFAFIKGYRRFGTGISTSRNNTFYGNDIVQRAYGTPSVVSLKSPEAQRGKAIDLNLGTSFSLFSIPKGPSPKLGLSLRYNNTTNTWGGGPGLMVNWGRITLGAGFTREKVSNYLSPVVFYALIASTRISIFEIEYNLLKNQGGLSLNPVHILSLSTTIYNFVITGAVRTLQFTNYGQTVQHHAAIQYLMTRNIHVGALYNFIPGATSLGLQFFL